MSTEDDRMVKLCDGIGVGVHGETGQDHKIREIGITNGSCIGVR